MGFVQTHCKHVGEEVCLEYCSVAVKCDSEILLGLSEMKKWGGEEVSVLPLETKQRQGFYL